ncbi:hypothetical protein EBN88_14175 [Streptomyces triticirhizae]|uniref:DNA primase/polymerase bifunctional N-terminal domain-containing protein n=1 Tax=Streptomyces triticirhizae TaxID=2483353 RepID=A0A3M2LQH1_9ACTN|nr:hypothetical protein EBN88_14175 [Streptomyces triticirhizae]
MTWQAIELADHGVAVTPLPAGGRVPEPGWHQRATTDPDTIRSWPAAANVGVVCRSSGEHGLVVLDLDGEAGERQLRGMCRAAGQRWPETLTVRTPHGWHLYLWARPAPPSPAPPAPARPSGPASTCAAPADAPAGTSSAPVPSSAPAPTPSTTPPGSPHCPTGSPNTSPARGRPGRRSIPSPP